MKVLICEAEPVLLSAIEFRLRKHGLQMVQSPLKDAQKNVEAMTPQLIILDIEHNPAESLQFVQAIKEAQPKLPIIIVSPVENEEELWVALQAGAEDFVTKPFKLVELVIRVRKLLMKYPVTNPA